MNYIVYGEHEDAIIKFINSLKEENEIEDYIVYDYKECDIKDVIEEANYMDLFGSKKLIVLSDADFLTSKSTLESKELESYIENSNPNTFLVFKVITDKLDERKKLVKFLKDKVTIKEFPLVDEKNLNSYISNYFKERKCEVDYQTISLIADRLKSNRDVLDRELDKLILYNPLKITIEDAKKIVTIYEDDNKIFKLVDAVVKRDKVSVFSLYKELIEAKEEPIKIVTLLAMQFRLMYQVSVLCKDGMNSSSIASMLKEHPYRIKLAMECRLNESDILNFIERLAEIDYQIKTGLADKNKVLETFFLEL